MKIVNQYMKCKSLPYDLQGRVREYLEFSFRQETKPEIQGEQIISERLSKNLISEVKTKIHGDILQSIPILRDNFKMETLRLLTPFIKTVYYRPGEIIIEVLLIFKPSKLINGSLP